ncbi:MAG: bifunctional tetrahydrofolate synthase/dihydrofolate synthase [Gammaproteobacteria bacterium]
MAVIPEPISPHPTPANLDAWLQHIAAVHPREIELGLERIQAVATRMGISRPAPKVITVGGTNGKGSTLAALNQLLRAAGLNTGLYTSPHIHRFNERIELNDEAVPDQSICAALAEVEQHRGDISLSYFEFATLAALWIFQQADLDVALLEVGLGGRLDAVNIIDADIAVITSISLDHTDWLGNSREQIAMEKAGILRPGQLAVIADPAPPGCLLDHCRKLKCSIFRLGEDYQMAVLPDGRWDWQGSTIDGTRALASLQLPRIPLASAATALQLLELLDLTLSRSSIERVLASITVPGRWELRRDSKQGQLLLLDVAHNPAAAALLAEHLQQLSRAHCYRGKVAVVLAAMADKDVEGIVLSLESIAHIWYIAQFDEPRGMKAAELHRRIQQLPGERQISVHESVSRALAAAVAECSTQDLIVVTGSFVTVSQARALSSAP